MTWPATQTVPPQPTENGESIFFNKALVVALFCILTLAIYVFVSPGTVRLTLEMSSTAQSTAQLYYDVGRGYNESDSRTVTVSSRSLNSFQELAFDLPKTNVISLRFDPLRTAGTVKIRNIAIRNSGIAFLRIHLSDVLPLHQIASRVQRGAELVFSTSPDADDPGLELRLHGVLRLRRWIVLQATSLLLVGALVAFAVFLVFTRSGAVRELGYEFAAGVRSIDGTFEAAAKWLSSPEFIRFDSYAIWFYVASLVLFLTASLADLNGSSIAIYNLGYGYGAAEKIWFGSPRVVRSDEWAYSTPDILNQSLRSDRFEFKESVLGGHSVALIGNIPVRHFTTIFRPQFWAFFVLPPDYAFAVFWQCKALILLTGVFSWLLLITRSSFWAATGSLWYFFSPFTQWSYSWPTGLPEMVGLVCLTTVLACYLTVGKNKVALCFAALGAAICAIDFALCGYPPQIIPLFWLAVLFFLAWSVSARNLIFTREAAGARMMALALAGCSVAIVGLLVFIELHAALIALANTMYPGKRLFAAAGTHISLFASHFMQWTETEQHFPPAFMNICEGSGFLWLAPATLLCVRRMVLSATQKFALLSLWIAFCLFLAWLLLPLPAVVGKIFALNRTAGARLLPALGLANIGVVVLAAASMRKIYAPTARIAQFAYYACIAALASALMLVALRTANREIGFFFSKGQVLFATFLAAGLITLLITGRKLLLAVALIIPQAVVFGGVNPVERGVGVVTSSELYKFVRQKRQLLQGKWIVFSDSIVGSGFLAATGCNVYTGTHYLPDIDHFPLFAANGLDLSILNRLGYLNAHLRKPDERSRVELPAGVVVQWDVSPTDPIIRQLGIKYLAFDQRPPGALEPKLVPLSPKPVDGFWLYRLP